MSSKIGTTANGGNWYPFGSGFLREGSGRVVTAYHVVKPILESEASIKLRQGKGMATTSKLIEYSDLEAEGGHDWALLEPDQGNLLKGDGLSIAGGEIFAEEKVFVAGYPDDIVGRYGPGVEIQRGLIDNSKAGSFTLSRPIPPGFSGGAVVYKGPLTLVGYLVGNIAPMGERVSGYGYSVDVTDYEA